MNSSPCFDVGDLIPEVCPRMFDTLQTRAVSTQNNLPNFRVCIGLFWVDNITSKLVWLFQTTINVLLKIKEKQTKWPICYTVKFVYLTGYIPVLFCPLPIQTAQLLQRYCTHSIPADCVMPPSRSSSPNEIKCANKMVSHSVQLAQNTWVSAMDICICHGIIKDWSTFTRPRPLWLVLLQICNAGGLWR